MGVPELRFEKAADIDVAPLPNEGSLDEPFCRLARPEVANVGG